MYVNITCTKLLKCLLFIQIAGQKIKMIKQKHASIIFSRISYSFISTIKGWFTFHSHISAVNNPRFTSYIDNIVICSENFEIPQGRLLGPIRFNVINLSQRRKGVKEKYWVVFLRCSTNAISFKTELVQEETDN